MAKYLETLRKGFTSIDLENGTDCKSVYVDNLPEGVTVELLAELNEYRNDFGQVLTEKTVDIYDHRDAQYKDSGLILSVKTEDVGYRVGILGSENGTRIVNASMVVDNDILKENTDLKYTLFNFDVDSNEVVVSSDEDTRPRSTLMSLAEIAEITKINPKECNFDAFTEIPELATLEDEDSIKITIQ